MHGGKTPHGIASPHFKHGKYSKYMPARLLEQYGQSQTDSELLAAREDIALVDARIADVLGRVDTGESGHLWREVRSAYKILVQAMRSQDTEAMSMALRELDQLINRGNTDYAAWNEVLRLLDQRRRLVESERKRLVDMQQMITAERAMTLVALVVEAIRKNVTDRQTLAAIERDLGTIIGPPASGGA